MVGVTPVGPGCLPKFLRGLGISSHGGHLAGGGPHPEREGGLPGHRPRGGGDLKQINPISSTIAIHVDAVVAFVCIRR